MTVTGYLLTPVSIGEALADPKSLGISEKEKDALLNKFQFTVLAKRTVNHEVYKVLRYSHQGAELKTTVKKVEEVLISCAKQISHGR